MLSFSESNLKYRLRIIGLILLGGALGLAAPAWAWDLQGQIQSEAIPQPLIAAVPPQYQAECGQTQTLPQFQIRADGAVRNAVVWVDPLPETPITFPPASGWAKKVYRLDQTSCEFSPHILLAAAGVPVYITNSDPLAHNVGLSASGKALANVVLPKKGSAVKKTFDQPGPYLVQCGIHPWMSAVIYIQKHPLYAVTAADGTFSFTGLPAGKYQLKVWHEGLGSANKIVSETSGKIQIVYPSPKRRA